MSHGLFAAAVRSKGASPPLKSQRTMTLGPTASTLSRGLISKITSLAYYSPWPPGMCIERSWLWLRLMLIIAYPFRRSYFAIRAFNVETALIKGKHMFYRKGSRLDPFSALFRIVLMQIIPEEMFWLGSWECSGGGTLSRTFIKGRYQNIQWPWPWRLVSCYRSRKPHHTPRLIRINTCFSFLLAAINEHKLTKRFLDRIIDARFRDLDAMQPQQLSELEE